MADKRIIAQDRAGQAGFQISAETRAAIANAPGSAEAVARQFAVNKKTVLRWRKRPDLRGLRPGPVTGQRRDLSPQDEMVLANFRLFQFLPLDDCLYALRPLVPGLTRSTLHRSLQRSGISRLPLHDVIDEVAPIGDGVRHGHVLIASRPLTPLGDDMHILTATDVVNRFSFATIHRAGDNRAMSAYLQLLVLAFPLPLRSVISTVAAADTPRVAATSLQPDTSAFAREIEVFCSAKGIPFRKRPWYYPWCAEQLERLGPVHDPAFAAPFAKGDIDSWALHLARSTASTNFHRRLQTLGGRTPFQSICDNVEIDLRAYYDGLAARKELAGWRMLVPPLGRM